MLGLDQEQCQCVFTYHALHTGEHGICPDVAKDPDAANWREAGLARGYASMASLPLKVADKVVGTFNLYAGEMDFFNPNEMRLLDEMATDIGFALEVSEREDELQMRDRAIKAVSQGIVITDPTLPDNPIIFASPGFEQMTGYSAAESIGKNCRFLQGPETDPEALNQIRSALRVGQSCSVELLNYRKDGSRFWNNLTISAVLNKDGQITHYVGVQTDVTQRRELEGQVRQAQKMEAIGQLAGGIAHDFNNLLTIINGYSELLLADTPPEDSRHALIQEILKAGEWSASLTGQLLAFSRKQVLQPQVLDLNGVIRETHKMLCRVLGEDIQLSMQLQPQLNAIKADPGQLAQVLVNLALNARDSMPQGGVLTIETSHAGLSETNSQAARTVCLSVTDTGAGMTPEIKNRLFEPFFTTKESGKGTGLGLPVVQGIVEQSGGQIEVFSQPGVGTSFKIYWPAQGLALGTQTESPDSRPGTRGNETIMLVEDDASVRALIKLILQEQGYHVLDARRGEEALRLAASYPESIDLLLTDVVMPGIGGRVLADRLKAERPEIRVLFMSGYTDDAVVRHGILHKHVNFLLKPFMPTALAHKVREVLAAPHSGQSE
ncbi:MAG: hybrid sensor histidine kinase/response regulator [Candidatus Melainabacteria bacterium HGW-Melainabacteria-1]|nr:MAG: hybrid sensor histidine kinase/response regulator [Candidatus Melainabacteria bacterium HGW-Melainabacteria-1]